MTIVNGKRDTRREGRRAPLDDDDDDDDDDDEGVEVFSGGS